MSVRVQIYTAQSVEEALELASLGVDHIGITPSDLGLPGEIDLDRASAIRDALVGSARSVALTVSTDVASIAEMARSVRPDILHLCGPPGEWGPSDVTDLRTELGRMPIMQAIAVTGSEALDVAGSFAPVVDYLLLDSVDPAIPGIGAAGTVHDWDVSAEIVAGVDVPVVLAGGLSPVNVGAAISRVRPWGVDSLTHTNRRTEGDGFSKDLELVAAFVAAAKGDGSP